MIGTKRLAWTQLQRLSLVLAIAAIAVGVLVWRPLTAQSAADLQTVIITLKDQPGSYLRFGDVPSVRDGLSPQDVARRRAERDARILKTLDNLTLPERLRVSTAVERLGGETIYSLRAMNAVVARVPRAAMPALCALPEVAAVEPDRKQFAMLDVTAGSMLVSSFYTGGFTGGTVDVAVIDTGMLATHPAFTAKASSIFDLGVFLNVGSTQSDFADTTTAIDNAGHGTNVAGMVFSQGDATFPLRQGIAKGLRRLYSIKAAYKSSTSPTGVAAQEADVRAAVDGALATPEVPQVINYSFGNTASADDDGFSRFWDAIGDDPFKKVVTVAAGDSPGASTVKTPGIAYNVISVGAVDDNRTSLTRNDDVVASYSSQGPTLGGRKKPDLVAPGGNTSAVPNRGIFVPNNAGGWSPVQGTSLSSAAIAGAAALLVNAGVSDPRAVKAILINSADPVPVTGVAAGWNAAYGWGYYNGTNAFGQRANSTTMSVGAPGTSTGALYYQRASSATTKATIVWNRHASYSAGGINPASATLNNIDLSAYSGVDGSLLASSTSMIDNVEQVITTSSVSTVLKIKSVGTFTGTSETVALATVSTPSGVAFTSVAAPALSVSISAPASVVTGSTFSVTATLTNTGAAGGLTIFPATATLALPTGYTLVSGGLIQSTAGIGAGSSVTATWAVQATSIPSVGTISVAASSPSYGETVSASGSASITAISTSGCTFSLSPTSQFVGSAGATGTVNVLTISGCSWSAASNASWLTITSSLTGSGSGTVLYSVAANTTSAVRTGTLTIAGQAFTLTQSSNTSTSGKGPMQLNAADAFADVFTYNATTGAWTQQIGNGAAGGFPTFMTSGSGTWDPNWTIQAADFNGDGLTDFFVYNLTTGVWVRAVDNGAGNFTYPVSGVWDPGWRVHVLDLNGDGRSDIFLYNAATGAWFKCLNLSDTATFTYFSGLWSPGWQTFPVELNGDGQADLFLYNQTTGQWFMATNDGGASFTYKTEFWLPGWGIFPGDFNNDAKSDIFLYNSTTGQWEIATNNGAGSFTYATPSSPWDPGWTVNIADFDANGRADVFLYNTTSGVWVEALNNGAGNFTYSSGRWDPNWRVFVTDFNGDRRSDVLLYNSTTGVWFQAVNFVLGNFTYGSGAFGTGLTIVASGTRIP